MSSYIISIPCQDWYLIDKINAKGRWDKEIGRFHGGFTLSKDIKERENYLKTKESKDPDEIKFW